MDTKQSTTPDDSQQTPIDDEFDDEFLEDEKCRKPKGKKLRKMKACFDR